MPSNDKLLAVLDMSEDEQKDWLWKRGYIVNRKTVYATMIPSLADLAFRLRDEVVKQYGWGVWHNAKEIVWNYKHGHKTYIEFCDVIAKPIHWIIAALIARKET
jgi:hypothetical protein